MEEKILNSILIKIKNPKPSLILKKWMLFPLWLALLFGYLIVDQLHRNEVVGHFGHSLALLFLGIGVGIVTMLRVAEKQWPFITPHLSKESIERRIDELST